MRISDSSAAAPEQVPEQVFATVTGLARSGDPAAQLALGQMLLNGIGTAPAPAAALQWFLASAARGVPMACNMVGRCCELGWGVPPSPADAMQWYERAARAGLDWGMYNYATGLALGWTAPPDLARALEWFRRAASLGHCKSFNIIGGFYEDGWAVPRDPRRARACYARAARGGDFRGCFNLGRFLLREGRQEDAMRYFAIARATGTPNFVANMDAFLACPGGQGAPAGAGLTA
ncbi:Sel1 domain protein repeat-containing protein [Gluconacetobacter diazotrophicus PA1 5]|uniref:Sel1 repeat family protein n=1 Tax=Gluconacetobacter diazotrophicus TaxID=33996 RepID=A0A7W4FDP7_GLUDI|nr:tetratricopeptide repeat protein [Gluconacetobacter diazotrophicus]ACI51805.1 Sel1 domain protein repeat-containing protein [Gluconacetobacter diazotrophicus PA1 5]MBB2155639.1 sel1 repeat family protein [Gluconacetobacter diazotrophicus]